MSRIYHYSMSIGYSTIPDGKIVHVGLRLGIPAIWVQHDCQLGDERQANMTVLVVGTGFEFDANGWVHAGTVVEGAYVWHVYQAAQL